jgi:hypothetical protein
MPNYRTIIFKNKSEKTITNETFSQIESALLSGQKGFFAVKCPKGIETLLLIDLNDISYIH